MRWSATAAGGTAAIMKYNLNARRDLRPCGESMRNQLSATSDTE